VVQLSGIGRQLYYDRVDSFKYPQFDIKDNSTYTTPFKKQLQQSNRLWNAISTFDVTKRSNMHFHQLIALTNILEERIQLETLKLSTSIDQIHCEKNYHPSLPKRYRSTLKKKSSLKIIIPIIIITINTFFSYIPFIINKQELFFHPSI
jgi:hypothetical protein